MDNVHDGGGDLNNVHDGGDDVDNVHDGGDMDNVHDRGGMEVVAWVTFINGGGTEVVM